MSDPAVTQAGISATEKLTSIGAYREYYLNPDDGSFAFLVQHGEDSVLVQVPSYIIGVLDDVRADVLFLSIVPVGHDSRRHTDTVYDQIVGMVKPKLVIPVHWDNFTEPVSGDLVPLSADVPDKFNYLIGRLKADGIRFGIMQGYQSILLFGNKPV